MKKLKLGIPDGSMVNPERGGLKEILDKARIYTKNLETNKIPEIINIPWLEILMQRPQELPYLAAQGFCDLFFCGDDWAREWGLRGYKSEKILGLDIGKVDIVMANKKGDKKFRIAASEYPFIAKKYLEDEFCGTDVQIIRYGEPITKYAVIDSAGKTELKIIYGIADFVIENTQTGSTLRSLGLDQWETLFSSECSLYTPSKQNERWKQEKVERIAMMLEGATNAKDKDLIIFNVGNNNLEKLMSYITNYSLFANEPTIIPGKNYAQITLECSTKGNNNPLIDVLGDLKQLGATAIEGIPLSYSIK